MLPVHAREAKGLNASSVIVLSVLKHSYHYFHFIDEEKKVTERTWAQSHAASRKWSWDSHSS